MSLSHFRAVSRLLFLISAIPLVTLVVAGQESPTHSTVLSLPITSSTAVSFYWFGDMDSHYREPLNFYVVSATDSRWHTVQVESPDRQWNAFISASEMKSLIGGLKALGLSWMDSQGREPFKDIFHRTNDGFLDVTVVSANRTAKAYIRIARMCDELARLDSVMPSQRILWQFHLFRVDRGCSVPGYNNSIVPPN